MSAERTLLPVRKVLFLADQPPAAPLDPNHAARSAGNRLKSQSDEDFNYLFLKRDSGSWDVQKVILLLEVCMFVLVVMVCAGNPVLVG